MGRDMADIVRVIHIYPEHISGYMVCVIPPETEIELKKLQYKLYSENTPVLILVEGNGRYPMGRIINEIMAAFDPRGVVYGHFRPEKGIDSYTYMRYLSGTPSKGKICLYDRGWYSSLIEFDSDNEEVYEDHLKEILGLERYIVDNGTILVKVYLDIRKGLSKHDDGSYPGKIAGGCGELDDDLGKNSDYDIRDGRTASMLERSDLPDVPWNIVKVEDFETTVTTVVRRIIEGLSHTPRYRDADAMTAIREVYPNPREDADLTRRMDDDYTDTLMGLQKKLSLCQCELAKSKRSLVMVFEGWDAAGKGGSIRRVSRALNPRGYKAVSVSAPTDEESSHSHLWRFCSKLPKRGHITIFDRSWYGRMMVEPIEGFCTDEEYRRSSEEINIFEKALVSSGAVVVKFWMEISAEEQLDRFNDRKNDPMKRWKITDEDWRNRSKWNIYERYVDSMIRQTNTPYAPWYVIESEDKKFGRVKVLQTLVDILEKEIG